MAFVPENTHEDINPQTHTPDESEPQMDVIEEGVGPEISTGPLYGHGVPYIDMSDFPFLEAAAEQGEIPVAESDPLNDNSQGDETVDYTEVIRDNALVGEYPFEVIISGITDQFSSYIGTEDKTNYVDVFYNQLHESYRIIDEDDSEEHPAELREVLGNMLSRFISTMQQLFEQRLSLTMIDLDAEEIDQEEIEYVIRNLYEFFILNARENFKKVISSDINAKIAHNISDDREFYKIVREMLPQYSPLVTAISPMEFLRYTENKDVYELFQDGRVVGNFLRKYTPKLYQYEEFEVEIISHIVMTEEVKEEILHGGEQ